MKNIQYNKKSFIILLILCMGIGFAFLTSNLNIIGNTSVSGNSWNVYFDNVQVSEGSVEASLPTIDTNKTKVNFSIELASPGDYYEFTVDAVNDGTIDAMIDTIIKSNIDENISKLFEYVVTYEDGSEIKKNDVLQYNERITYKVFLQFKRDISISDLSSTDVDLNLSFEVNYVQSDKPHIDKVTYGEIWAFEYTGGEQEFVVPETGNYKLEVWGAQGGNARHSTLTYNGGFGGYSTGVIELIKGTILYINVGGQGGSSNNKTSDGKTGYNGGGYGSVVTTSNGAATCGGGGATHIATVSGVLKQLSSYKDTGGNNVSNEILIVAGGGGGAEANHTNEDTTWSGNGGSGGGYVGADGICANNTCHYYGTGGTQIGVGTMKAVSATSNYSNNTKAPTFGFGQNYTSLQSNQYYSGGGGGWYGGASGLYAGAGGGSGYIGNENLTDKSMYCYNCNESSEESTKTISTTDVSENPVSNYSKIGNGYAKITKIVESNINLGNWKKTSQSVDINNITFNAEKGEVSFVTSLTNTIDYAELTFEIENNSDKDYYISKIIKSNYDNSKVNYSINYSDGTEVEANDLLLANSQKYMTVKIQLLDNEDTFNGSLSFNLALKEVNSTDFYIGTIWEYNYVGKEENFIVPYDGEYKIEVWGAQGGSYNTTYRGGYGAYSTGTISLTSGELLYVNVGGAGKVSGTQTIPSSYNGGGSVPTAGSTTSRYLGSGGGATHMALVSGQLSTLSDYKGNLSSTNDYYLSDKIIIVAGGGGGSNYFTENGDGAIGGNAGGYVGSIGKNYSNSSYYSNGGTQINAGSSTSTSIAAGFGYGQTAGTDGKCSSGGGGGFFGGNGGTSYCTPGGGGSGYIGNLNLTEKAMYCFDCTESVAESTKTISTTNVSETPISQYAKIGSGYAKITYLGE